MYVHTHKLWARTSYINNESQQAMKHTTNIINRIMIQSLQTFIH